MYDKDGAIQKRCAPGRITYLIDMNGIIRFVQEGIRKSEDLLRELENLKKLERREMRLRAR